MRVVRIYQRGGPEVMVLGETSTPTPRPDQVLIKVAVAGVSHSDIGQRRGDYPNLLPLPAILGNEVAGIVVGIGSAVTTLAEGMRVVALVEGGYAEYAVAPSAQVSVIPDGVSFAQATVVPIQGQTAYLLLDKASHMRAGERVLIHAAAGGVGSLALQLARLLGAILVIGSTRSPEKLSYIRALGADMAVNSESSEWVGQVMQATLGQGVDVILDAVGGSLTHPNLACLSAFGRMVVFGALSSAVTPVALPMLIAKCLTISGYNTVIQPLADQMRASQTVLEYIADGRLQVTLGQSYALAEVVAAHQAIEAGHTQGQVTLTL